MVSPWCCPTWGSGISRGWQRVIGLNYLPAVTRILIILMLVKEYWNKVGNGTQPPVVAQTPPWKPHSDILLRISGRASCWKADASFPETADARNQKLQFCAFTRNDTILWKVVTCGIDLCIEMHIAPVLFVCSSRYMTWSPGKETKQVTTNNSCDFR